MASTTSPNLGLQLIGTGDQSGTWGTTTNVNLGTLLEEAIVGYATQVVADTVASTVLTIDPWISSTGRNYVIELTSVSALSANRTVEVPTVEKSYIFFNNTSGAFSVTIKTLAQVGGVTIANGKKAIVYVNGTNVISVVNAPVGETDTQTLTNKNIRSRVVTLTDSNTVTLNGDTTDIGIQTNTQALGTLTVAAPTGTPFDGQKLIFRLKSTNAHTFSWNAIFASSNDVVLPLNATGSGKFDYVGFMYNATNSKWQILAKSMGYAA